MTVEIGVVFDGFDDAREMIRLARGAEAAGAASVWVAEHMGWREAVTACAGIAVATETVRLVPTAISPYLWHPTPTAMALATLEELAPGRVAVAVSVGNLLNLKESGHEPVRPVAAIGNVVSDLRALWTGRTGAAGSPVLSARRRLHELRALRGAADLCRFYRPSGAPPLRANRRRRAAVGRAHPRIDPALPRLRGGRAGVLRDGTAIRSAAQA